MKKAVVTLCVLLLSFLYCLPAGGLKSCKLADKRVFTAAVSSGNTKIVWGKYSNNLVLVLPASINKFYHKAKPGNYYVSQAAVYQNLINTAD